MIGLVLDEVMAQAVNRSGMRAPTAEMTVRFRRPAPIGEALRVTATRPEGRRLLICRAEVRDTAGALIAEATGKFLPTEENETWKRETRTPSRG
jgi:acyl-coenzyme A thioesterase PaaI-like protein